MSSRSCAGPLAAAKATQDVIAQQTVLAEREADLKEKQLEAEVRRPADAEAYRTRTTADANRDRVKAETEAEAFRQRTIAEASRDTVNFQTEAEANRQRKLAEAGAEAETIKAQADATAKKHEADGDAYAQRTVAELRGALSSLRAAGIAGREIPLVAVSARDGTGVGALAAALASHLAELASTGALAAGRRDGAVAWAMRAFVRRHGELGLARVGGEHALRGKVAQGIRAGKEVIEIIDGLLAPSS